MEEKEKELRDAAGRGDEVRVQQLLAEGVDVNAEDGNEGASIHFAARNGHTGTVQALLTAGVTVDARSRYSEQTPLHCAANKGHTGTLQALLTAGADIDARTSENWTPLHHAAHNGHPECVKVLLKAGATTVIKARFYPSGVVEAKTTEELAIQEDVLQVFQLFKALQPKVVDNLLTIDLSGKGLTSVPAEVFDFKDIERLVLSNNRLTSIPKEIGQLQKLRTLKLDNNLLTQLPQTITTLPNLQCIVLSNNRLTSIPEEIGQLQKLQVLKLDNNLLTQLPQAITSLPNLQNIDLSDNKLETLPDGFSRLQLHELYLQRNGFKEIPEEVCSLLQLNTLSIGGNPLKCLPDKISQLTGLKRMKIYYCQFDEFPRQVLQLEGLETLDMENWAGEGRPSPVPEDIGKLKKLKVLSLQNNDLDSLTDGVGELLQLTYLNIAGNRFTSVPEQIMKLSNIRKLVLSNNRISRLPLALSLLAQLKEMDVSGNPLTYPPPDVCKKGTAAIMDYLRREMKEKEEKELKKLFYRFSRNVKEPHEVEDLAGALGIGLSSIQASKDQTPSSQGYNVLLKWMETEREASMDKLQQELSESGMDRLAHEAGRIKAQPVKRPADTSGGPPAKRPAAGESRVGHEEEQQSKDAMAQVLQENHRLRALVEELQGNKKPIRRVPGAKPVVLLLNDEYGTAKGGVSTIHCQMTGLLASKGAEVYSTVLSATQQDQDDAAADGVQLIFPTISERDKREPCLDWLTFDHKARYPDLPPVDFILGHVPITSHAARQIKEQRFPDAKLVQVTHVVPEDTNQYKGDEKVMSIGDEQKGILEDLKHADVIISVGPYMHAYYRAETGDFQPHYEFLPKPSDIFSTAKVKYIDGIVQGVLSVGRVKGVERLKGYDLSAAAMGKVIDHLPHAKWRGRGVSAEDFPESKAIIQANMEKGKFHFTPLKYGTQRELIEDMKKASVVLMPSRAEPFGLVGLEAIAAGVPVVVSDKSGLAMFLKKQDPEFDRTIVKIDEDDDKAAQTLADRVIDILNDGSREFKAAQSLKKKLLDSKYWAASHTKFVETFGLKG